MSYDVSLMVNTGTTNEPNWHEVFWWNYTTNCARMWREAGAELAEMHGKPTSECAPVLAAAIEKMKADPDTYKAMDPPNGWGSYDSLLPKLAELHNAMIQHPTTTVEVSR